MGSPINLLAPFLHGEHKLIYRCILAQWAYIRDDNGKPSKRVVHEGEFTDERVKQLNSEGFNIYWLPNSPSIYEKGRTVDGSHIDQFDFVFVDMDLKEGKYPDKDSFIIKIMESPIKPSFIVDSGNGVHVYWKITDLDPMSYLRLQRRLCRYFDTDPAVSKIYQLMRVPGTLNTKSKDNFKPCESVYDSEARYTAGELDSILPPIDPKDEEYCKEHFDSTFNADKKARKIDNNMPPKFSILLRNNQEVADIWAGNVDDRSKADYRLGHLLYGAGFNKDEALSVLANTEKARDRNPNHRINYASNIVEKVWEFEDSNKPKNDSDLAESVRDILSRRGDDEALKGVRFPCSKLIDNTHSGFRLSHVMGLVGGVGVGKTGVGLNLFKWFVEGNPEYDHLFVSLEQPVEEIAERWRDMCGAYTHLHDRVHILGNYNSDGTYRHLSIDDIRDYILNRQKDGRKIGCVIVDHIAILKKAGKHGERQDIVNVCEQMKAFAIQTNTFLVMQSQTTREKAGIGDIELNKDAAYGTSNFESYCDYLVTLWQPLKRCYTIAGCPTVTAFKFCKIRHKKQHLDIIKEDVPYLLFFDSATELLRELTQDEEKSVEHFNQMATNQRDKYNKSKLVTYKRITVEGVVDEPKTDNN